MPASSDTKMPLLRDNSHAPDASGPPACEGADAVSQGAVRRIQEMIRTGELKPNTPLPPQRQLAAQLRVSRASLREAISVLGTLGLLRTEPRQGTFVVDETKTSAQLTQPWRFDRRYSTTEVYQFRFVTEAYAANLSARHITKTALEDLRENHARFTSAVRDGDWVASSQCDFNFHKLIMVHSGNRVLADFYENNSAILLESQRLPMSHPRRRWEPVIEHENILRAIEKGDQDNASYFMHVHLLRSARCIDIELNERA
jgi:GntR family transcriptional repressor for pyruvate dehydrogenase complex